VPAHALLRQLDQLERLDYVLPNAASFFRIRPEIDRNELARDSGLCHRLDEQSERLHLNSE
jgi:hypothetical protein